MILQTEFARPDEWRAKSVAMLGPTPAAGLPNAGRNRYATDLLLRIGLPEVRPDVVFVWYSDPDTTAHARGLDDSATRESLTLVDGEIGRIEDWLRDQGRLDTTISSSPPTTASRLTPAVSTCLASSDPSSGSSPTARPTS